MYSKTDINNQPKLLLYSILYLMICLLSRDVSFFLLAVALKMF